MQCMEILILCPFTEKEIAHFIHSSSTDRYPKNFVFIIKPCSTNLKSKQKLAINNMKSSLPREECRAALIN